MPPLPDAIILVFAPFPALFSHRVWLHTQVLLVGAILAPGPRTETAGTILANVVRLNHYVDLHRCGALVVRSGKNFTYLAGFAYPGTLGRHLEFPDSPREVLLVWPRRGEPVMILNQYAAPLARRDSWLRRIELYDAYKESPYTGVAEVLRKLGLDRAVVAFERTYLSAARWEMICILLPHMTVFDCTEMSEAVR